MTKIQQFFNLDIKATFYFRIPKNYDL